MAALRIIMWIACGILVLLVVTGMGGGGMGPQELAIRDDCIVVLIVGGVAFLVRRKGASPRLAFLGRCPASLPAQARPRGRLVSPDRGMTGWGAAHAIGGSEGPQHVVKVGV
jgi:hypothetical protein